MYFNHAGYVQECLYMPLFLLMVLLLGIVSLVVWSIAHGKMNFRKKILLLINLLWISIFLGIATGQLSHGGIYLLEEKETDAVKMQGYISEIKEFSDFSIPIIECDYYENMKYGDPNGYEFTINGIQCTAPVKGLLKSGDYVSVTYLPKSRYILYIDKVEQ